MGRIDDYYALRRRRLVGLGVLGAFLAAGFALNGWTVTPIWTLFDRNEGNFVAGDPFGDWIYAVCDGKHQQITVSRDGRLEGADALRSLRTVRFPNWCDLPTVDNPDLVAWQSQLGRLLALTSAPESSEREILDAARAMPISYLYLKPLADWIHAEYAHAVAFLDAVAERPMRFDHPDHAIVVARRQAFSRLVDDSLNIASTRTVAPERLERWLAESQIAGGRGAVAKLATMGELGTDAAAALLKRLNAVPMHERGELYSVWAPRLVHEDRLAALLTEQLRLLPPEARSVAARRLLAQPDVGRQFPLALLTGFRRTFRHASADSQLDAFVGIAGELRREANASALLASHLRDIPDMQRRMAATYLLTLDAEGESQFALNVLRAFGDLHPMSRAKVAHAVMQSSQFHDRAVQEAALLAVRLETRGPERQELLQAMLRHRQLDADLQSRIRAELG